MSVCAFRDARPDLPLAVPIYPARALAAKAGRVIVGVRVIIDTTGQISSVAPSLRIFSTPGPFEDDFLEAVRAALRQWRFSPAYQERLEDDKFEAIETYYDVAFTFTATGSVQVGI